jgi:hypothetical protein
MQYVNVLADCPRKIDPRSRICHFSIIIIINMVERRENINQVATQIQSLLQRSGLSMTEVRKIAHDMKDLYENHDYEYICAVLFPASSPPARIPERFGLQSALFTHRFKFYVNTGVSGSGFVSFLPQDVTYKCVYKSDPAAQYTGN